MSGFLNAFNNVTRENVKSLVNNTDLGSFAVKINNQVYGGWLFFIVLLVILIISFMALQRKESEATDQPVINLLYSFTFCSILSLLLRAVYITSLGVREGLITDHLMWVFPIGTILLAFFVWISREA